MAPARCPTCGAPVSPGAGFCAYCGASLPGPAPAPLRFAGMPPSAVPPGGAPPPYFPAHPPSPRRRSRLLIGLVILVVLLLVVGVIGFAFLIDRPPPVQVLNINIWSPDNVCGLNSTLIYFGGYNSSKGANETVEFKMPNYNSSACDVRRVSTTTPGFVLYDVQVPRTIPPGVWAPLNITIKSPSSPFSGNLNLFLR
ncbi:MAG: zinc ribbon domain-containing protein [Thermoplasmata archaeon]